MTQNEINMAILAEIKKVANEVFANVKISRDGLYTAAELHKGKNAMGKNFYVFYDDNVVNKVYTIEVGTSIYRIGVNMVFYALWQFEKLCHVKQGDKMRFTYGNQDGEHISAKAMYLNKEEKAATRKKNLIKLSERVAIEMDKKTKSYNMYYLVCGLWYLIALNFDKNRYKAIYERIEKDENYLFGLLQRWDFNNGNRLNPIYKALFDAMKSEQANNTSEQRKCENEAKNAVICDRTGESAGNKGNLPKTQVASATGYNLLPFYLRQKVFPTEPFYTRRKISRFKPRYFVGYTNYRPRKENVLERKRNGNTSVYRALIRSETDCKVLNGCD